VQLDAQPCVKLYGGSDLDWQYVGMFMRAEVLNVSAGTLGGQIPNIGKNVSRDGKTRARIIRRCLWLISQTKEGE
jgi:hypothetical protein